MDDLDERLTAERARVRALLVGLDRALDSMTLEQAAEMLPLVAAPLDGIVERVRKFGVPVAGAVVSSHAVGVISAGTVDPALPCGPARSTRH